ncbi:hypothetical protein WMY93_001785 [Mugilogobius chulae]|uniref:Septin-type G domain-containing protein n=1 Tax=Mugilogobius chulae TaxID=88201 RepID=A0AAW0Q2U4_9GOBI
MYRIFHYNNPCRTLSASLDLTKVLKTNVLLYTHLFVGALKRSFDIDDDEDIPPSPPPPLYNHRYLRPPPQQQPPLSPPDPHIPLSRPRAVMSSLSFNHKPLQSNGSCVNRAASFHTSNGYSGMFGAGSDNDSLHSSTSSLEFSGGGVSKLPSYPCTPEEPLDANFNHRKFTSESKNIPDFYSSNGGTAMGSCSSFKFANANWNGRFRHNSSSFGEEHHGFSNHSQKPVTPVSTRKTPQLNKFPLDLDNIVNPSTIPQETYLRSPVSPLATVPPLSLSFSPKVTNPSGSPGSSASLNSLDSSDTPPLSLHQSYAPVSPPGPQRVPRVSPCPVPLSPAQTPRLQLLSGPQGCCVLRGGHRRDQDSVGSILQRIASFSQSALNSNSNGTSASLGRVIVPPGASGRHKDSAGSLEQDSHMEDTEAPPATTDPTPRTSTTTSTTIVEPTPETTTLDPTVTSTDGSSSEPAREHPGREHPGQDQSTEQHREHSRDLITSALDPPQDAPVNGLHADPLPAHRPAPDPDVGYISGAQLFGYVGIEAVLDQMRRKTVKAGFEFNVMVVGQSGEDPQDGPDTSVSHVIEEKGVKMKLTVVDTPGFGDHINNNNCWEPIVAYVKQQYEKYLREELNVTRKRHIPDTRVHCCVYFLPPTGHRLRAIDVEFMKHLGTIVSIVPVIAKADTLTLEERLDFKHRIRQDLAANGIQVYPQKEYDEDPEEHVLNSSIRECIPFAVVGTDREHQVNGNKVLGRKTKWGIIEVENAAHCEFSLPARSAHQVTPPGPEGRHPQHLVRDLPGPEAQPGQRGLQRAGSAPCRLPSWCSSLCSGLCEGEREACEGRASCDHAHTHAAADQSERRDRERRVRGRASFTPPTHHLLQTTNQKRRDKEEACKGENQL